MNSAKVLVRRNSYDDLTPLYKPPSQTEFESVEQNRNNNDYGHSGNDQRSAKLEDNGLYDDLYDFHDIPIEDQLMMAHGIRPHGILDEDNDEGNFNQNFLLSVFRSLLNEFKKKSIIFYLITKYNTYVYLRR